MFIPINGEHYASLAQARQASREVQLLEENRDALVKRP
jgi:hypothetical protein